MSDHVPKSGDPTPFDGSLHAERKRKQGFMDELRSDAHRLTIAR